MSWRLTMAWRNLINLADVNKQQADGDSRAILGFAAAG